MSNEWAVTQDIGRAARRAGFAALLVPSAAGEHRNLVVFRDLLAGDETVATERVETAPQD